MSAESLYTVEITDEEEAAALFVALAGVPNDAPGREWAENEAEAMLTELPGEMAGEIIVTSLQVAIDGMVEAARQDGREEARYMGR